MDIYNRNIEAKRMGPAVLVEPVEPSEGMAEIKLIKGVKGFLTSEIFAAGSKMLTHSVYNPMEEADKMVNTLDFTENRMIIVFGLGLGYHLFEIRNRMGNSQTRVLVIENDANIVENALRNVDFSSLFHDRRFHFIFNLDKEKVYFYFCQLLRYPLNFFLASDIQFFQLEYFDRMYAGYIDWMSRKMLDRILIGWSSLGNSAADTFIGLLQSLYNIDEVVGNYGINHLRDKYSGKPAIIVAAGPSLDKNYEMLRKAVGKATIIACDVILGKLLKKGIKPDVVISLERVLVYEHCFKELGVEIPADIVYAAPPLVEPKAFRVWEKNKKLICFKQNETISEWYDSILGNHGTIFMGNNVGNTAFGLALALGSSPIIFTGQDLAFGEDGDTHAGGIQEVVKELAGVYTQKEDEIYLKGYYGKPVRSTKMWQTFLINFEIQIAMHRDRKFINATEGGALIDGTENMRLEDAVARYCKGPVTSVFEALPDTPPDVSREAVYEAMRDGILKKLEYFRSMYLEVNELQEALDAIYIAHSENTGSITGVEMENILRQLGKADKLGNSMISDTVSIVFFQGLYSVFMREVKKLGFEVNAEKVWDNVLSQKEFLSISKDQCFALIGVFEKMVKFIEDKLANKDAVLDYEQYLKICVTQ